MENGRAGRLIRYASAGILGALIGAGAAVMMNQTTVVLLTRHAEKAAVAGDDPPLSVEGQQRAQTLAHVAGSAGVSAIFATQYQRTQQTVQPIATHLGLTTTVMRAADTDAVVERLRSSGEGPLLVAGHSNTVPEIIAKLNGGTIKPIIESEYDNLYVVIRPRWGRTRVIRLHYGNPTLVMRAGTSQR